MATPTMNRKLTIDDIATEAGEHVVTTYSVIVSRGTAE